MAPIVNGKNDDIIKYFSLEEYVSKIKLAPYVLEHLEDTNKAFNEYLKTLRNYDQDYIINYWIYLLYRELKFNQEIEEKEYHGFDITKNDLFFSTLSINHNRIQELHQTVTNGECEKGYRKIQVYIGATRNGKEEIIWRGVEPCDVDSFMNDFIKIYKQHSASLLYSNLIFSNAS